MSPQQVAALRQVGAAIIHAANGAPAGIMYAALMAQGCTLHQFEQITGGLVRAGMLTRDGDMLTATENGRATVRAWGL